ncbi:MAG: enoyl-CoA hydratase [Pseudomonadota bacterium]
MSENIKVSRQGRVQILTISRPDRKNALTQEMYAALADGIDEADQDDALRATLITGEGDVFTSGNDISDFATVAASTPDNPPPVFKFLKTILNAKKPIVAAVNGPAVGVGLTLLLHCDIAYGAESSTFRAPFVKVGVVPEAASSLLLPRVVGMSMANEIMLGSRVLTASEALTHGLISRLVPDAELMATSLQMAETLASLAPGAMTQSKALMRADRNEIDKRMDMEFEIFAARLKTPEFAEATAAFLQKREANFD